MRSFDEMAGLNESMADQMAWDEMEAAHKADRARKKMKPLWSQLKRAVAGDRAVSRLVKELMNLAKDL